MKKRVISLIACLMFASMFTLGAQASDNGNGEKVKTKVMSFNIHHGADVGNKLDLQRIADVIRDSGAEIIGLQEVDRYYSARSDLKDQPKELAEMLGYHYAYGANLNLAPAAGQTENRQYGTAILSKYPILEANNVFLSSFGKEQRGLLHAVVNVKGVRVNVFNTHLGLDVQSRMVQAQEIIEIASAQEGHSVLVGDFNATPDSEEFKLLLQSGLFVNAFEGIEDAYTFPVVNPNRTIDYILTSPGAEHENQRVINTDASDHLPIVSDVTFKRPIPGLDKK
ncbi:endonuclease/exonuclease/phosphatase family protein [Paenibacillus dakarensis]|uniref:endonuclease/exonuclease/phosphatase family protein n=1 Tax=Paenibacillus dakarensis TaxID=1527293 RepID=UPI0006D59E29|nr:endonuclease/exonuclease/phosphatase family protein [Paenibacillus dakarensis]